MNTVNQFAQACIIVFLAMALAGSGAYAGYLHFKLTEAEKTACPCGKSCPCKTVPPRRATGDLTSP